jgi:hypothetical protein
MFATSEINVTTNVGIMQKVFDGVFRGSLSVSEDGSLNFEFILLPEETR